MASAVGERVFANPVRAGEARDQGHDLVGEIRRDPVLTEEQKRTLVHIYQSFRAEREAEIGPAPAVLVAASSVHARERRNGSAWINAWMCE